MRRATGALQFRGHKGMSFRMVGKGKCEIQLEGQQREHLREGDLVLPNAPPRWMLMDGFDARLEDFETTYAGVEYVFHREVRLWTSYAVARRTDILRPRPPSQRSTPCGDQSGSSVYSFCPNLFSSELR